MSRFLKQALAGLDRLYGFPGGLRGSPAVDIEAPVTVVHDVSAGAEREAGFLASWTSSRTATLGTISRGSWGLIEVLALFDSYLALGIANPKLWWLESGMQMDAVNSNLAEAAVGLGYAGSEPPNTFNTPRSILALYANATLANNGVAGTDEEELIYTDGTGATLPSSWPRGYNHRPVLLNPDARGAQAWLREMVRADAVGSCTVEFTHHVWIAPRNVPPPGWVM